MDSLLVRSFIGALPSAAASCTGCRRTPLAGETVHRLDGGSLVCEVADAGHISDPLVGRRRPGDRQLHGRGLWLVQQLCDLVQVRTEPGATVVRVQVPLS